MLKANQIKSNHIRLSIITIYSFIIIKIYLGNHSKILSKLTCNFKKTDNMEVNYKRENIFCYFNLNEAPNLI